VRGSDDGYCLGLMLMVLAYVWGEISRRISIYLFKHES